jgi:hypothetical protein
MSVCVIVRCDRTTVERVIGNFLTDVWRSGALEGTKAEEAFFGAGVAPTVASSPILNGMRRQVRRPPRRYRAEGGISPGSRPPLFPQTA